MTNINTTVEQLAPSGLSSQKGYTLGWLGVTAKAAQNDTVTVTNASEIVHAEVQIDSTGAAEPNTLSANEITLTSVTTGSVRGFVLYKS